MNTQSDFDKFKTIVVDKFKSNFDNVLHNGDETEKPEIIIEVRKDIGRETYFCRDVFFFFDYTKAPGSVYMEHIERSIQRMKNEFDRELVKTYKKVNINTQKQQQ